MLDERTDVIGHGDSVLDERTDEIGHGDRVLDERTDVIGLNLFRDSVLDERTDVIGLNYPEKNNYVQMKKIFLLFNIL